ncbi:MAG TPA: hypothetical protein VFW49_10010, partial [Fluviicoccus sp.]|nr:hypothetical protein [Fluviicoccus sp.]
MAAVAGNFRNPAGNDRLMANRSGSGQKRFDAEPYSAYFYVPAISSSLCSLRLLLVTLQYFVIQLASFDFHCFPEHGSSFLKG